MIVAGFLAWLPLMLGLAAAQDTDGQPAVQRLVLGDQVIVRVPVRPPSRTLRLAWAERRGPKCISARSIRGAMLAGPDHVDILLVARQRVRAHFAEDCPALDFYAGFYLKPEDDRVCAGRDSIHSRIGGSCEIQGFGMLVPVLRRSPSP